ncbi:MAG: aspartate/glutamate racemase family protein, partial [Tumebacillaceae bacterium]
YRILNELVKEKLGGLHSAKVLLHSLDFAEIEACQRSGDWDKATAILMQSARGLELAGADVLLIGANTMHKMYPAVQDAIQIPVLHIADSTAEAIKRQGLRKVGLLATRYTMEHDFYKNRLQKHGLEVVVPDAADRDVVHGIIYEELCKGIVRDESKARYVEIIGRMVEAGIEGVILGCTEIPLLIRPEDTTIPQFDTTYLHAQAAVTFALS